MPNVGYATLQVIPSVRGIGDELRRQLIGPAAQAGERAGEEGGSGFRDAFKGALAALGVEAIAEKAGELFSEAFSQAMEQGNLTSKLQAQLGASSSDASRYGKVVGSLYAKGITESFEQGAEAVRSIVNAGLVPPDATNKQLQSIATEMTDVANTFGTELGLQTQAVSALMKNDLEPNAESALDVITYGLQHLGPNAEDLLETFQEYPVQLRKLGLDAQTSLGLFQQGLQGGARDTDIIADALKEFSIRSIDMSTTSRAAYKQLGFNHQQIIGLEQQIARGGAGASSGLDTVLDKLRAIHDPVKRESAAVGLFGTQAEDLGSALFDLDPSSAIEGLGHFDGAAKGLGDTLRSGPSYEITLFKRTVQQGLVNFIGGQVLPALARWGRTFNDDVLPPLQAVGGEINRDFLPAVRGTADVVGGIVGWFKQWGIWLVPVAILIGGISLALTANAIATGISTAAWDLWLFTVGIGEAVVEGFAGAMALLNAVMEINPFVLIVVAVLALGAALVIAYKKSDTFRGIVQGAWQAIQDAAQTAWRTVLKPVVDALVAGWDAIAKGATWLWQNVLVPFFNYAMPVLQILATIVGVTLYLAFKVWWTGTKLYIDAIVLLIQGLAAVGVWLYNTILKPIIDLIVFNFRLWYTAAKLYVEGNIAVFQALATVALWLWSNVLKPVVGLIVGGLHATGDAAKWLWTSAISPAFHGIATVAQWLYDKGIKPPLDKGKQLAKEFGGAFTSAKDTISTEWGKLSDIAKRPIAFIIDTVYNKGLVGVWNKVAGAFGGPKLGTFPGFATGGILPGYTPGRDVHLAALSGGEAVMRPEWTRAVGPGYVTAMNAIAARGGVSAVQRAAGPSLPGFAFGGVFDPLKSLAGAVTGFGSAAWNKVKQGAAWLKETARASAEAGVRAVVDPLLARIPGLDTGWGQMVRHVPDHMISALFSAAGLFDSGGVLRPGATMAVNATGRPEAILTASQWATAAAAIARTTTAAQPPAGATAHAGTGRGGVLQAGQRLYLVLADGTQLDAYVDTRVDRSTSRTTTAARAGRRQ